MFSCKYCDIFKSIFFVKHLRTSAFVHFKIQSRIQHAVVKYLRCFFEKLLVRCLTGQNTSLEKKLLQGWTNFFRGAQLFGHAILLVCTIGHAKNRSSEQKCSSNGDTTRNISFCSVLAKPDMQLSF